MSRQDAYKHRELFPDFAAAWDEAKAAAIDALELKAWNRAGRVSDTLTIFMLKAHRPDVYSEKVKHELTGKDGGAIEIRNADDYTDDELAAIAARGK